MQIKGSSKNASLAVAFLALISLLLAQPQELVESEYAGTNTGIIGANPSLDGSVIAFTTYEDDAAEDLNGDGDRLDRVIRYYDILKKTATSTGAEGYCASVYGTIIAFAASEADAGVDLNGDGDTEDSVIRYYDIGTGEATNTGIVGGSPVLNGDVIAFDTYEGYVDQDLNGDGDTKDDAIGYYEISTDVTTYTSAVGSVHSFDSNRIAFHRWVEAPVERGWFEAGYCDISTDEVTVIGAGDSPSLDGDVIAFGIWERHVDEDLNGDQDEEDKLIWYYVIGVDEPAEWPSEQAGGTDWNLILIVAAVIAAAFVLAVVMLRR